MKAKAITAMLLSSTLLFSNSIVGAWTIDVAKAEKLFNSYAKDEMKQFVISMMVDSMKSIEYKKDGSCTIGVKSRKRCWKATKNAYILYEEDEKTIAGKVNILGPTRIELKLGDGGLNFEFTRMKR